MNLTKAKRAENLKKWKATPPAVIKHPLRAIHERFPDLRDAQGNNAGPSPQYAYAKRAAHRGHGLAVNEWARAVLS